MGGRGHSGHRNRRRTGDPHGLTAGSRGRPVAVTAEFLAGKRIAVTGVSRTPKTHGANNVYKRLRERGYEVFAVNPNTDQVEGDPSYPDLASIPGGVQAVVIGTRPEIAEDTMRECAELGIKHVWMHRGPGAGSVSAAATSYGRAQGITVIDGGCPLMFGPTADARHKIMRLAYARKVRAPETEPFLQAAAPVPVHGLTGLRRRGGTQRRPATTHWEWLDLLAELDPSIDVRRDERFVDDGDLVTSAGVSAGIDMALHLVARLASTDRAREVRRAIQYDPAPPI